MFTFELLSSFSNDDDDGLILSGSFLLSFLRILAVSRPGLFESVVVVVLSGSCNGVDSVVDDDDVDDDEDDDEVA